MHRFSAVSASGSLIPHRIIKTWIFLVLLVGSCLRKIRQGIASQGKSGGFRVIMPTIGGLGLILLLVCFSKNDIENISATQQAQLTQASQTLIDALSNRNKR
jgi:hypothetical protein